MPRMININIRLRPPGVILVKFICSLVVLLPLQLFAGMSTETFLEEMLPIEALVRERLVEPVWFSRPLGGVAWRGVIVHPTSVDFIAIHFSEFEDSSLVAWKMVFKDKSETKVFEYTSEKYPKRGSGFWTEDLPGNIAIIEVYAEKAPIGLKFKIDKYLFEAKEVPLRSIIDPLQPQMEDIAIYPDSGKIRSFGKPVARLRIIDRTKRFPCTGFLIGTNVLMTNDHCLPEEADTCDDIQATFGSEGSDPGERYLCSAILKRNYPLDYALLRLEGEPGKKWGILKLADEPPSAVPLKAVVIHHPGGNQKMITINKCLVQNSPVGGRPQNNREMTSYIVPQDFQHSCDTEGGSSGAPVLDEMSGMVQGLHHYGFTPLARVRLNQGVLSNEIKRSFDAQILSLIRP